MRQTRTNAAAMVCMDRGMCMCCCCMVCADLYREKKKRGENNER